MSPQLAIEKFEIFATGLDHPECLAFDREGFLWAGGEAGQIYRIDPAGKVEQVANLGSFNAGVAFSPDDQLFVCNPAQGVIRVARDGRHQVVASHAGGEKIICANFGVFDTAGNLYVTDSGEWMKGNGRLLKFTPDGEGTIFAGPFGYANGLALTGDGRYLFMAVSDRDRVLMLMPSDPNHLSIYATDVGRMPDGLALARDGTLIVCCYASDEIWSIDRAGNGSKRLFAHDRWAIKLSRPTNLAFHDGYVYVANLGRQTITRAKVDVEGQPLANQRAKR